MRSVLMHVIVFSRCFLLQMYAVLIILLSLKVKRKKGITIIPFSEFFLRAPQFPSFPKKFHTMLNVLLFCHINLPNFPPSWPPFRLSIFQLLTPQRLNAGRFPKCLISIILLLGKLLIEISYQLSSSLIRKQPGSKFREGESSHFPQFVMRISSQWPLSRLL